MMKPCRFKAVILVVAALLLLPVAAVAKSAVKQTAPVSIAPQGPGSVKLSVELDKSVVKAGAEQPVYILLQFNGRQVPQKADRPPLNLALVLDRSGSMEAKGKLDYLKTAAKLVVDALDKKDRLAVIEYDDKITTLWPSTPVEAPEMIKKRIDSLRPRGRTNLTGGMMAGVREIEPYKALESINRVILLSDGLANEGITRPAAIRDLVRSAKERGVAISTMGLGLQYNEDLMQDIAQYGGGNYYYIENPLQMSRIFKEEIAILFTSVAKEAKLVFKATPAVKQMEIFGYKAQYRPREAKVTLGGFYSGEKRSLLIRLMVATPKQGTFELGSLNFSYMDMLANRPGGLSIPLAATASGDEGLILASVSKKVSAEAQLIEADKAHEEAVKLFQKGKRKEAQQRLAKLAQKVKEENRSLKDERLHQKAEALTLEAEEMDKIASAPPAAAKSAQASYLKKSKQRLYQSQQGNRSKSMLVKGAKGLEVEELQKALAKEGFYKGPVDGKFSDEVTTAIKKYQAAKGLKVDGVAGPKTLYSLGLY